MAKPSGQPIVPANLQIPPRRSMRYVEKIAPTVDKDDEQMEVDDEFEPVVSASKGMGKEKAMLPLSTQATARNTRAQTRGLSAVPQTADVEKGMSHSNALDSREPLRSFWP